VINDARTRVPSEDADTSTADERGPDGIAAEGAADDRTDPVEAPPEPKAARGRKAKAAPKPAVAEDEVDDEATRSRPSLPLVPVLSVLLVLLLGAAAFLWFTRPEPSAVTTADYTGALQAARSNVVDFTSFDHLTLDDDIRQVERVAVGDLRDEAVDQLDSRRQEITDAEAVVSTEVIEAGVIRVDAEEATVLLVIQTTRQTNASEQAEVVKYRIEVEMQRSDDRWVLTRITGV
jgi:Mce-associated membrane protein